MGGHGGLNILPQKKWNVYNFENREKVRKDEEAAAREEQLKREQSRRRDAEFRLDRLRQARGIHSSSAAAAARTRSSDSGHINLFSSFADLSSEEAPAAKKFQKEDDTGGRKRKREEAAPPVVGPEDEKYKLGYGLVGKGVKTPWYLSRPAEDVDREIDRSDRVLKGPAKKSGGKMSIEELREERVKRERKEKERERAVLNSVAKKGGERGLSRSKSLIESKGEWERTIVVDDTRDLLRASRGCQPHQMRSL